MIKQYFRLLKLPLKSSHKGQNGKLLIIGGSHLFHAASLWALEVASRIVDLVHYASTKENNKIIHELKREFRNGIIIPRTEIENYIEEDDCVLIGPGMVRAEGDTSKIKYTISNIKEINRIIHEGMITYHLSKYLLLKYPHKKWVIDAGALQMIEPQWIPKNSILTPHKREFLGLISKITNFQFSCQPRKVIFNKIQKYTEWFTKEYNCLVLLKGETDIITSKDKVEKIRGGNAGMTKGGTGDVLAGLVAGLYCKNDAFLSAVAGSYINKKAGEELFREKGYWYNASDLAKQIPKTMRKLLIDE